MNQKILEIAKTLKRKMLDEVSSLEYLSVFLCGGSRPEQKSVRREIGKKLSQLRSKYRYTIHYPEDMFVEILLGHKRKDLLTLENLLAESVNAVVILLHSPGTFAELGAFSNHNLLRQKLIVVVEPKHGGSRSFINLGPLRFLKSLGGRRVLYQALTVDNLSVLVNEIARSTREISDNSPPIRDLSNPVAAYEFYLALIYIFDPIEQKDVIDLARTLTYPSDPTSESRIITVAEAIINSLINEKKLIFHGKNLSITAEGIDSLINKKIGHKRKKHILGILTNLRLQAMNLTLRRKLARERSF